MLKYHVMEKSATEQWIQLANDNPLRFRKEILPIEKGWQKDGQALSFDEEFVDTVVSETTRLLESGVKSPLVLTHDGQEPYGQVVRLEKSDNDRGGKSMFAVVDFENVEMAIKGRSNDVSVFIPPKTVDGKGNSYTRALQHLALTPYPVVHGMDRWQAIAASFSTSKGPQEMKLSDLAKLVDAKHVEGDDAATTTNIEKSIKALKDKSTTCDKLSLDFNKFKEENKKEETLSVSALMLSTVKTSRDTILDQLVKDEKLDASSRDKLSAKYCSDEGLTLCMSQDKKDDFDFVVGLLGSNSAIKFSGRNSDATIDEQVRLALHDGKPEGDSPVVKLAKERATAATGVATVTS